MLQKLVILVMVLLITLVITIFLLGSTIDKITQDSLRLQVISSLTTPSADNSKINQFKNTEERQEFINNQVRIQSQSLGLDEPWYSPKKLFNNIIKIVSLDLGKSRFFTTYSGSNNVNDLILEKMPNTILLFTSSSVVIVLIGLFFGAYIATKEGKIHDKIISSLAPISLGVPAWWFSMMMIVLFSFLLHIFPARATPLSTPSSPNYIFDLLYHMTLPFITLVLIGFASSIYYVKYITLRILDEDYIKSLRIMGIPQKKILYKHALKNAGPQLATMLGLGIAASLTGSILVEEIFDWPGMGNLFYNAIIQNDSPLIIGLIYFFTLIYLLTRLVLDICFMYLDPRIRAGET
ncbi:MAG: ABC transporter permease [Thermoproteota archaeon]|nr:ABC transporter permease [Thermoproteota archaeon]